LSQESQWALLPEALLQDSLILQERTALVVNAAGQVQALLPASAIPASMPQRSFPGEVWAAAPVMAHAHLESFDAPSLDWGGSGFSAWVEQLLAWRQQPQRLPAEQSAALSLAELQRYGCGLVATHVAEAGADGAATADVAATAACNAAAESNFLAPVAPQVLAMQEVFAPSAEDFDASLLEAVKAGQALALHAPFSIACETAAAVFAAARGSLISIHLGEHAEEREYLAEGTGPLADLLAARGRSLKAERFASPVDWLQSVGGLKAGTLAVHGGDLNTSELQRLAAANVGVVFCPGTHVYFGRGSPTFVAAGAPLPALGCDSRASNQRLDPLRELKLAFALMPQPGAQAWWHALTKRGAEVLQASSWGSLAPGKTASVLRLSLQSEHAPQLTASAVCEALCTTWQPPVKVERLAAGVACEQLQSLNGE
jgi:cytosine/adenosine deaminase-related metal-dependent hydrolase